MSPDPTPVDQPLQDRNGTGNRHDDDVPWESLMARAQDGDRVAYHALLQSVTPYLRAIARRYLGPGEDVEDAVQEVLLVVHGIRHTYERGRPFKPWLGTIASRRCIDLLRKRTNRLRHEFDELDALPEHVVEHCVFAQHAFGRHADTDAGSSPADEAERAEVAQALHDAVDALPERQREAVRLLRLKELSLSEAATHSHQTTGAIKVAYHRALKSLRRAMGGQTDTGRDNTDD